MASSPIYGWAEPDNTDLVKNGALAIRTLGNAIDTTMATMTAKSTYTAKGSIAAATAASTPANLSVGNNGESLLADSSTASGLRYQTGVNVNQIINGGFDFFQRGTSSSANGYACADRWYNIAAGTTTFSQDTSVPTAQGVQYSYKWTTGASSSYGQFYTALESATVKPLRGQAMIFSFWVKTTGTAITGTLQADAAYSTSTDAYVSQTVAVTITGAAGITPTATWTKYSGTLTIPSDASGLKIGLIPTAVQASGVVVYLAAVQLELGSVGTSFKRAGGTIQGELAACQRYYWRSTQNASSGQIYANGFATTTTAVSASFCLPVQMRVVPTSIGYANIYVTDETTSLTPSAMVSNSRTGVNILQLQATVSGATAFRPYFIIANGINSYVEAIAEL
jgi:hypothetical protein